MKRIKCWFLHRKLWLDVSMVRGGYGDGEVFRCRKCGCVHVTILAEYI